MRLSNTEIINKLFPVKSSELFSITIASPAGNTNAAINFPSDAFSTVVAATDDATPANEINIPAINANANILPNGMVVFPIPPSEYFTVACFAFNIFYTSLNFFPVVF